MSEHYTPISCAFHDRLEAAAVTGKPCELVYRDADDTQATAVVRITDVFTHEGAEYIATHPSGKIRLDRIVSLDGAPLPPAS